MGSPFRAASIGDIMQDWLAGRQSSRVKPATSKSLVVIVIVIVVIVILACFDRDNLGSSAVDRDPLF